MEERGDKVPETRSQASGWSRSLTEEKRKSLEKGERETKRWERRLREESPSHKQLLTRDMS